MPAGGHAHRVYMPAAAHPGAEMISSVGALMLDLLMLGLSGAFFAAAFAYLAACERL